MNGAYERLSGLSETESLGELLSALQRPDARYSTRHWTSTGATALRRTARVADGTTHTMSIAPLAVTALHERLWAVPGNAGPHLRQRGQRAVHPHGLLLHRDRLSTFPYRSVAVAPAGPRTDTDSSLPAAQLDQQVCPPRARSPRTDPAAQFEGSAGKRWITPAWLCRSISAIPAVAPKLPSI